MSLTLKDIKSIIHNLKDLEIEEEQIIFKTSGSYAISGDYTSSFYPHYQNIDSLEKLAKLSCHGYSRRYLSVSVAPKLHEAMMLGHDALNIPDDALGFASTNNINYVVRNEDVARELKARICIRKLHAAPAEFAQDGKTYRVLATINRYDNDMDVMLCESSDSLRYNYMDLGMYLFGYKPKDSENTCYFFSKEFDGAAWRVIYLLSKLPSAANAVLQDGCFLNAKTTNIVIAGLTKRLGMQDPEQIKNAFGNTYAAFDAMLKRHWLASAENRLFAEFKAGDRPSVVKHGVTFTKDSASYEKLTFVCPDIVAKLDCFSSSLFSFEREFDIYKIANVIVGGAITQVLTAEARTYVINGITIVISKTEAGRYKINNITVNKDEVMELVQQAFCFTDVAEYTKLITRVSKMSLMVHNAWSNGLLLRWRKLPENQVDRGHSFFERDKADKWKNNPRLRFKKEGERFYLYTGENDENKLLIPYFTGFVRGVANINNTTNWRYSYNETGSYKAAENRLVALLVEKTKTKTRTTKQLDGTIVTTGGEETMTQDEARNVLFAADTVTAKAIEKSKQFLDGVVVRIGAEQATLNGMSGYKVKGAKHTYFVDMTTNRAHSFETGQYICIVDSNHGVRIGYDELATRLMALKNDTKTVARITTLSQYVK